MASPTGFKHLAAAQAAYGYTLGKLKFGQTNKPYEAVTQPVRQLNAMDALLKVRAEQDKLLGERFVNNETDPFRRYQAYAEAAEKYGAGNCEEAAAVAFMFLVRQGLYPSMVCRWRVGYHAFVMVGMPRKSWVPGGCSAQPWYPDAVICDAQDKRCGFWADLAALYPESNIVPMVHDQPGHLRTWQNL